MLDNLALGRNLVLFVSQFRGQRVDELARFSVNGYRGRDNCVDYRADEASVFFDDLAGSLSGAATLMTGREHQGGGRLRPRIQLSLRKRFIRSVDAHLFLFLRWGPHHWGHSRN
jgi:hypothetical protein